MNQRGFAPIALIVVVAILVIGGIWYYLAHEPQPAPAGNIPAAVNQSSTSQPTQTFPPAVKEANAFLVARVGQNVFDSDFTYDSYDSHCNDDPTAELHGGPPAPIDETCKSAYVIYSFVAPSDPAAAKGKLYLYVSPNGSVDFWAGSPIAKAPQCSKDPSKCDIAITSSDAVQIAQKNSMSLTWSTQGVLFRYSTSSDSFYWDLATDLFPVGCGVRFDMAIDAHAGAILSVSTSTGVPGGGGGDAFCGGRIKFCTTNADCSSGQTCHTGKALNVSVGWCGGVN